MASSPTKKSLAYLRRNGYTCAIVEKYNTRIGVTQDLFGFIDILAVGPLGTLAVQTTSKSNFSSRWGKITGKTVPKDKKEEDRMLKIRSHVVACLAAGWVIEVHGWEKSAIPGPRIQQVSVEDLVDVLDDGDPTEDLPF